MNKIIIIILIAIVILVLVAGGIWWFYSQKPAEQRPAIISALFPFAEEKEIEGLPSPSEGKDMSFPGTPEQIIKIGNLTQLSSSAISGAGLASTTVRYVEKLTGHIYEINPDGQNRQRLSNTTILKTFESFWSPNGNKIIIKYFGESGLKVLSLNLGTTTSIFLPESITGLAVSPGEEKIFYLALSGETFKGITASFENKNQKNIFNNSFGEFNISWPQKDIITLLTKPSVSSEGFFYSLNAQTGSFTKLIGGIKGLTALLSPDGARIIYSESQGKSLNTKIFNIKQEQSNSFDLKTLPEKCVWSKINKDIIYCAVPDVFPSASYPDDWYRGIVSFRDSVWQKDFSMGKTDLLVEQTNIDIINPLLTQDEKYLIFTNKNDNTLWSLKLK